MISNCRPLGINIKKGIKIMANYNDYSLCCFGNSMYGGYYIEIWDMSKLPKVELISKRFKLYNELKNFASLYQLKLDKAYRVDH